MKARFVARRREMRRRGARATRATASFARVVARGARRAARGGVRKWSVDSRSREERDDRAAAKRSDARSLAAMAAHALEPDADVVPTGHAAHALEPAFAANVPDGQKSHAPATRPRARPGSIAHCHSYPNVRNRRRIYARRAPYSSALKGHQ